jgi:hypothetical protein
MAATTPQVKATNVGAQIISFFEQAARAGGIRAKVRLAELTQTPTALASVIDDSDDKIVKFDRALAQVKREFAGAHAETPTIDQKLVDAVPDKSLLKVGYALLAERQSFINDQQLTARRVTESATKTLQIERAGIWLLDDAKTKITCIDLYESAPRRHGSGTVLFARDFRSYFQAIETERILDAVDAVSDARTSCFAASYLKPLGISSMMDIPLWSRGRLKGVLCCEHVGRGFRAWTAADKNFGLLLTQVMGMHYEAA